MKNDWPTAMKFGVASVVIILAIANCDSSDRGDRHGDNSSMAYVQCKNYIKSQLKSPSSADFASITSAKVYKPWPDKQQYTVTSYVDAQNAFGANLRSRFICEIEWNGKSSGDINNWTLINSMIE